MVKTALLALLLSCFLSACDYGQIPTSCNDTDYHCIARQDAYNAGIPILTFDKQIQVESGFQAFKYGFPLTSPAGAIGIAQIMPSTATIWGVDATDPIASLKAAADHMAIYDKQYDNLTTYYTDHYDMALGCYNAGCSWVDYSIKNCSYWLLCMPLETQRYVKMIDG